MGELTELALATISQAQRRVEIVGQNMANAATPAYKRQVPFSQLVTTDANSQIPQIAIAIDSRAGKLMQTGSPSDLALSGPGFFVLRRDSETVFARNGQLTIDGEGRLIDRRGFALQMTNGNDLIVQSADFKVGVDGSVTDKGAILGKIAVVAQPSDVQGDADPSRLEPVDNVRVKQGAYEASNVTTGDEMVAMIEALRRAESGQRIMNAYDDLMGRVITAFGESGR